MLPTTDVAAESMLFLKSGFFPSFQGAANNSSMQIVRTTALIAFF